MIAISLADFSASGVPDYLLTTPDYAQDRATIKELAARSGSRSRATDRPRPRRWRTSARPSRP